MKNNTKMYTRDSLETLWEILQALTFTKFEAGNNSFRN